MAIKAGQRLKAIRFYRQIYRQISGADLKEAAEVEDRLIKYNE